MCKSFQECGAFVSQEIPRNSENRGGEERERNSSYLFTRKKKQRKTEDSRVCTSFPALLMARRDEMSETRKHGGGRKNTVFEHFTQRRKDMDKAAAEIRHALHR